MMLKYFKIGIVSMIFYDELSDGKCRGNLLPHEIMGSNTLIKFYVRVTFTFTFTMPMP